MEWDLEECAGRAAWDGGWARSGERAALSTVRMRLVCSSTPARVLRGRARRRTRAPRRESRREATRRRRCASCLRVVGVSFPLSALPRMREANASALEDGGTLAVSSCMPSGRMREALDGGDVHPARHCFPPGSHISPNTLRANTLAYSRTWLASVGGPTSSCDSGMLAGFARCFARSNVLLALANEPGSSNTAFRPRLQAAFRPSCLLSKEDRLIFN